MKQYYADNHNKLIEYQKQYDDAHKEQIKNRMKVYSKLYREKKKAQLININNNNGVQQIF